MLHVQRNVLNAKRRPSDFMLEAHGDSAAPVVNEAGIPGAYNGRVPGSMYRPWNVSRGHLFND